MAQQSNADLRLFNGHLSALFLDLSFQFLILHLLVSVHSYTLCFLVYRNLQTAASILYYISFSNFNLLWFPQAFNNSQPFSSMFYSLSKILLRMSPLVLLGSCRILFFLFWVLMDSLVEKEVHNMICLHFMFFFQYLVLIRFLFVRIVPRFFYSLSLFQNYMYQLINHKEGKNALHVVN